MNILSLDVIVPCYQECDGIERFHASLTAVLDGLSGVSSHILYIDDGSTDGTLELLNGLERMDCRVQVYSLSRNFGHQVALSAGLDVSRSDVAILMDSDLQHPPSLIVDLCERYCAGYDVVSAVRAETVGASLFKRTSSHMFYSVFNRLSDMPIEPGAADFCLLSRRAKEALIEMPERHRFLRGMIAWVGFPRAFVKYVAPSREAGVSKYTSWRMMKLAMDAVFSFSTRPILLILKTGLAVVLFGIFYLCYEVVRYLICGDAVRGWPSLVALITMIGGLQLVSIAVCGGYIARIFEEEKRRPLYFFKQKFQVTRFEESHSL